MPALGGWHGWPMTETTGRQPPLLLNYRAEASAQPVDRRWRVVSLLAMLPALVVPFVPFACEITPVQVTVSAPAEWLSGEDLDGDDAALWLSSLPLLLAVPIVFWKLRLLAMRAPTSKALRGTLMMLGAACAAAVAGVIVLLAARTTEWSEAALLAIPAVTLLLAGAVFVRLVAARVEHDARVSIALLGPYAANAGFCLALWSGAAQLGWYLTLAPAAAALVDLCLGGVAALAVRRDGS